MPMGTERVTHCSSPILGCLIGLSFRYRLFKAQMNCTTAKNTEYKHVVGASQAFPYVVASGAIDARSTL